MKADQEKIKRKMGWIYLLAILVLGLFFFGPAGTLSYWQAWMVMGALLIPAFFVMMYFLKHDPGLLIRRMRFKEKETLQKAIIRISQVVFFSGLLVPGLDYRFGWSHVPAALEIGSAVLMVIGYAVVFLVFKENSYASRIVEVEKGQKVITTGPYSIVRHPMYVGVILMYLFMPIALGSYVALIFFVPIIGIIIARTLNEEKVLLRGLKGYREYTKKVKYRLIPGVW